MLDTNDEHKDHETGDDAGKQILPVKKPGAKLNKGGLIVLCIIAAVALFSAAAAVVGALKPAGHIEPHDRPDALPDTENDSSIEQKIGQVAKGKLPFNFHFNGTSGDYIAVVHIEGVIEDKNKTYDQAWLLDTIDDLMADSDNKALMLYIDSPGGGVYQADEVYLELEQYRKTGKPVYAYMGPLAASGGYYIACAAQNISANRNTLTGSIGVIAGQSIDATGLLNKIGIKATTITAGKNKNMMNFNAPLTDEQKGIMQAMADEAYDQFTGIVAQSRKMDIGKVKALADGRVYTANQAVKNGLIDTVCSWDDALNRLRQEENVGQDCSVEHYRVQTKTSLYDYMTGALSAVGSLTASVKNGTLTQVITHAFVPHMPYPAYYYAQ